MIEKFEIIFNICIGLGIALPLLDAVLGIFSSILNFDIDVDLGGHGASADNFAPINIMCICFSLVVFGAVGRLVEVFMINTLFTIGCFLGLIAISIGSYIVLYKFVVAPLKKNNAKAITAWDLLGTRGTLTLRINADSQGTVSLKDSTGAMISYVATAKEDVLKIWEYEIPQGIEVTVIDVDLDKKTVFIKPVDTFENLKLKNKNT